MRYHRLTFDLSGPALVLMQHALERAAPETMVGGPPGELQNVALQIRATLQRVEIGALGGDKAEIEVLARVLEPLAWAEYDAQGGKATNAAGQTVLQSLAHAERAVQAGWRSTF